MGGLINDGVFDDTPWCKKRGSKLLAELLAYLLSQNKITREQQQELMLRYSNRKTEKPKS
jgi:hypothetical protein